MSNFAPKRTTYDTGDNRWLRDLLRSIAHGVTVTTASFNAADIAADGWVKSGVLIAGHGLLKDGFYIKAGEKHLVSAVHDATVDRRYLPRQLNLAQETALTQNGISFINGTVPTS